MGLAAGPPRDFWFFFGVAERWKRFMQHIIYNTRDKPKDRIVYIGTSRTTQEIVCECEHQPFDDPHLSRIWCRTQKAIKVDNVWATEDMRCPIYQITKLCCFMAFSEGYLTGPLLMYKDLSLVLWTCGHGEFVANLML